MIFSIAKKCCIALALVSGAIFADEMPEPYCSIKVLPFDGHGWFGNAPQLLNAMEDKQIETVIEVGSWLGSSTRFLADYVAQEGKVYAIDTWRGSDEDIHKQDPRLAYLYQQFLSNVIHAGLTNVIIPCRMKSLEAASALQVQADLIYLDAAHDMLSVHNDIINWYPHLKPNGIMCGDDWTWPSVQDGVRAAAAKLNLTIAAEENFWRFE